MVINTIKFSEMTDGGDLPNNSKTPGLLGGDNVLFNNPWVFLAPGTTSDRPIPDISMYYRLRFNVTINAYEYYDPNSELWVELSGSGTGSVNPGAANDLAFYQTGGQSISPIASNEFAVLVTNDSGVPSLSTVLPVNLVIPEATITDAIISIQSGTISGIPSAPDDLVNKSYVDSLIGGVVTSVSGTANRITSTGGLNPVIDIAATYAGQASITTLGTIATGTWQGTPIDLSSFVSGNLAITHLAGGAGATAATFWCGDGTWKTPPSSGSGTVNSGSINQVAWYSANGTAVSGLATAANSVLVTSAAGVPSLSATLPNGLAFGTPASLILTNATGLVPATGLVATGTPSATTYLRGDNTWATISTGSTPFVQVSGISQVMVANTRYASNNAALTTFTMPATAAAGDTLEIKGVGAGGWIITANPGQTIRQGTTVTTSGGTVASESGTDDVKMTCIVANTTWKIDYSQSSRLDLL